MEKKDKHRKKKQQHKKKHAQSKSSTAKIAVKFNPENPVSLSNTVETRDSTRIDYLPTETGAVARDLTMATGLALLPFLEEEILQGKSSSSPVFDFIVIGTFVVLAGLAASRIKHWFENKRLDVLEVNDENPQQEEALNALDEAKEAEQENPFMQATGWQEKGPSLRSPMSRG
ncbi:MAG: hypothetical protein SFW66_05065 [Gammaproteobacteria bacterium]|nr:hypothetical protein [Gammaproteobacteria bacterium]